LAPKANSHVEHLIGSIRRECLDQMLIVNETHLQKVLDEYSGFFNEARRTRPSQQGRLRRCTTYSI
jgi:hypothetical protein